MKVAITQWLSENKWKFKNKTRKIGVNILYLLERKTKLKRIDDKSIDRLD